MNEHATVPLDAVGPAVHTRHKRLSKRRPRLPTIEIRVESSHWKKQRNATSVVRRAIHQAALTLALPRCEVSILLADDAAVRTLNRTWRHRDRPTNVLSFPAEASAFHGAKSRFLGDIVIAYQRVAHEACVQRKTLSQHLAHLSVHGFLHLLGYDHETDAHASAMERIETMILARLNVPDPYRIAEIASGI